MEYSQPQDMNALLMALLQNTQAMPASSAYDQSQAAAEALQNQLQSLDKKDDRASGILGFFGRRSRDKKRAPLNNQYQSELAKTLAAKKEYEAQLSQYNTQNDIRKTAMTEFLKQQFKDNRSTKGKEADELGYTGPQRADYYNRQGSGVTVNTGTPQSAQDAANLKAIETRTENAVNSQQKLIDAGNDARRAIPNYDMGLALLKEVETKPFAQSANTFKKYLNAAGVEVDMSKVANYEQLAPIFGEFLLGSIQQTKGAISDNEMRVFKSLGPNYEYTTEANRRLLTYAKMRAERDVAIRNMVMGMNDKNAPPSEVARAVDAYMDAHDFSGELAALVKTDGGSDAYTIWKRENGIND